MDDRQKLKSKRGAFMKVMPYLLIVVLLLLFTVSGKGQQTKHVIFFKDKNETSFSLSQPTSYLSARAIARRLKYTIPVDSSDLPIIPRYIDSVVASGNVTLIGRLRWMNAVIIQTSDATALTKINSFSFVKNRTGVALRTTTIGRIKNNSEEIVPAPVMMQQRSQAVLSDTLKYGNTSNQVKIHNGNFLHNMGARGQGMHMAFLDGGFFGYLTNPFFDSARIQNRIIATRDFVLNESSVNEDNAHGMACFSIVAGNIPGSYIGTAPSASFYLLRTEDVFTEQIIEEYNWGMGAEYADSAGVDVISSSLGYTTYDDPSFNHTYAKMNGNTTIVSRYADMAAKKGMLVVNSAGNEGNSSWKYIVAPADGDSVLSVGAVNSAGTIASFSSFGPTSDGQIKPDVVSVGQRTYLSTSAGTVGTSNGTSFSGPNIAGLATCLWQLFPEFNNYQIIEALRQSADRNSTPHEQYGYGLPDMKTATGILVARHSTLSTSVNNCTTTIQWNSKDISSMQYRIERKLPGDTNYTIIQTVAAKGNTFSNQSYQYNDVINNSSAGTVNYRIVQVIDTSIIGYRAYAIDSSTVTVTSNCISNTRVTKLLLFPNPTDRNLQLRFMEQSSDRFSISIYNMLGQLLYSDQYNKPSGMVTHAISVGKFATGKYLLVVERNGQRYAVEEFVKH